MTLTSNGLLARVSTAHLISHLHIMAVPAMLPLLPRAMEVGFVELGLAIGVFNVVSALVQAPLGFLVDRVGARRMLLAALALGSFSFALVALFPSYPCLIIAMGLAGLANGVYHPADYSLLSHGIAGDRMGRAYSIHTFAGFLGGSLAPPLMVGIALASGVRWSFAFAAVAGLIALVVVGSGARRPRVVGTEAGTGPLAQRPADAERRAGDPAVEGSAVDGTVVGTVVGTGKPARPLMTPVATLALLTLLFTMLSLSTGAIEKFSVSALVQGFAVDLTTANLALTVFLFASAFGVLAGGVLADRTEHHGQVAAAAFGLAAALVVLVILVALPPWALVATMASVGFLTGMVAPSRDMLVRAASPAGAEGRTFGIVSTGFNVGGVVGPLLFGFLLDRGWASSVLWASVGFMAITTVIVLFQERRAGIQPKLAVR